MYSVVTTFDNTVLYNGNLLRVDLKFSPKINKLINANCWAMSVLT